MALEAELLELLRPLVRRLVREEVKRAKLEQRWVPVKKAAELLDLTEVAVRSRVRRDQLPGRNVNGKVFVDMEEFDRRMGRL